jgi:hydroxymethylpyrimidine/phosphomethylpyrimidine kinase
MPIANVLSIAGSDPSGGAGIQADLKTFSALETYGMAVISGLTAQNTQGVQAIENPSPSFVDAQLRSILEDVRVDAIKIGMLGSAEVIERIAARLRDQYEGPVILDPVMVSKSGHNLLAPDAVSSLREHLLPLATLLTPNLPEADVLTGLSTQTVEDMVATGHALLELGPEAVLLKGGHLGGDRSPDLWLSHDEHRWLEGPRIQSKNTHGTGCTLSSAIAAYTALGGSIFEACERAKTYVSTAIEQSEQLSVGQGIGPVHHFHPLWNR